jgi:hypothetical protein
VRSVAGRGRRPFAVPERVAAAEQSDHRPLTASLVSID